jgi:hypothetical protein
MHPRARWLVVFVFAIAMAWLEAASVFYIRAMFDRIEPYQQNPLPLDPTFGAVELVREAATLVMLLTVGALAGRTWQQRLGYTAIAFGVWDILYYAFLRAISGWPASLLDWDVLFLLPLPWWGPVLTPMCIALLMIVWGTLATQPGADRAPAVPLSRIAWGCGTAGILLALYAFMADAIRAVQAGRPVTGELPVAFNWPVFAAALLLMAAAVAEFGRHAARPRPTSHGSG